MSSTATSRYLEGDWFLVPLLSGGYCVGRVARFGLSSIYCFFFGDRFESVPDLDLFNQYSRSSAIAGELTLDLAIKRHEWPLIGSFGKWNRDEWTMPHRFQSGDRIVELDPDDPSIVVRNYYAGRLLPQGTFPSAGTVHPRILEWNLDYIVPRTRFPHRAGDVFLIPYQNGEFWFACVVFWVNSQGFMKASFFGPWAGDPPHDDVLRTLRQGDALFTGVIRDSEILRGTWLKTGRPAVFDDSEWVLPIFKKWDRQARHWVELRYVEENPLLDPLVSSTPILEDHLETYPDWGPYDPARVYRELDRALQSPHYPSESR